ncbi:unnamed protein product [Urochloa humidicola]
MAPWSGLWGTRAGGDAYRGTLVVVKMENPNWSISEISSSDDDDEEILATAARRKGGRTKNAKQIRWVLLLKAHRAAGCLASLASAAVALGGAARWRVAAGRTDVEAGVRIGAPRPMAAGVMAPEEAAVVRSRGKEAGVSEKTSGAWSELSMLGADEGAGGNAFPWSNAMLQWQRTGFHFQPQKNCMNDPSTRS